MHPLEKVASFILTNQLFEKKDKLLVAVSGGIDSMTLGYILQNLSYAFDIAHMNFRLRGKDSDEDEEFVRRWAAQSGIRVHISHGEAQAHATKKGISIQMAARELRYTWFEELRRQHHYDYVLTAHHSNDNLETVLLNLVRGTFAGFHGILVKNGYLVRPLLCLTRQEIEQLAQQANLTWREDTSNATDKYQRNFIRHHVVPLLKTLNPHLENTTFSATQAMQAIETVATLENERLKHTLVRYFDRNDEILSIDITQLRQVPAAAWHLYCWLKSYGFSFFHCQEIMSLLDKPTGKRLTVGEYQLVRDRKFFYLTKVQAYTSTEHRIETFTQEVSTEDFSLYLEKKKNSHYILPQQADVVALDWQLLEFPLILRPWQEGDRFQPLGMIRGTKKVSDFLKDLKIPSHMKSHVWVLCSGEKISWVVGLRIDERFKVTPQTQDILEIHLIFKNTES